WGEEWLKNLRALAMSTPAQDAAKRLTPLPTIRVLEGIPPKHPKQDHEKSGLLKAFQDSLVDLTRQLRSSHTAGQLLRPAYYFTGCDPFLRDYLMWPLFRTATGMEDPFRPYFQLWRHGVKYRVFQETQVDLYMPRR
ncbi:MAG: apolipoprotein acyltransferase, partial [Planctomycetota bacterium]